MVKLGINGFGRLGRQLLKIIIKKYKEKSVADLPKVVMINDANLPQGCAGYLLKNDSYYGKFSADIAEGKESFTIDGLKIDLSREATVDKIPWSKYGVEYVIDTSGQNANCAAAAKFLSQGVKRVIVTGCSNIPMFIIGVNHPCFAKEMKSISAATPSMNCLATLLRCVHEHFEIQEAMATAFHPLTSQDKILDDTGPANCRQGRSAIMSFSPIESSTKKKFVDKIMPELEGKTESAAFKIPVPCVGGIDLTVKFKKQVSLNKVKCKLKEVCGSYMKDIVAFSEEDLISSDVIGNPNSCIIDSKSMVLCSSTLAKMFAWYDSEYAFAHRLFDLAKYIASREDC